MTLYLILIEKLPMRIYLYINGILIWLFNIKNMDALKDPQGSRVVKSLPLPPQRPLPSSEIFKDGKVDWVLLRAFLKKEGKIAREDFHKLVKIATSIFSTFALIRIWAQSRATRWSCHYCGRYPWAILWFYKASWAWYRRRSWQQQILIPWWLCG